MKYGEWDEVVLKVKASFGYRDTFDVPLRVTVIGHDGGQYLCYVPPYETPPVGFSTFLITKLHVRYLECDPRFIGDTGCFITDETPIYRHVPVPEGEVCDRCGTFYEGAERGGDAVYLCWSCRDNPYR